MDCMAAMPAPRGWRAGAFITKAEKAKKTPAISPQPSAARNAKTKNSSLIIRSPHLPRTSRPPPERVVAMIQVARRAWMP
jgi:hypothetical protein